MKILAFAATNHKNSINKQLVTHAANVLVAEFANHADIELLDLNDYEMPIYSQERQAEGGIPPLAQKFFDKIASADAVIISFAEHNGNYTAAYKNVFDWASRIEMKVYQDKKVMHLSSSMGPNGGANVLGIANGSAPFFGADLKASFAVGPFNEKFDTQKGELIDPVLAATLRTSLKALIA